MYYTTVNVETDFGMRQSLVEVATSSYFPVLGLNVARGRWIAADEDVPTAGPVAVVSDHAWRTRFGSDPGIVGRAVRLGGSPVTITDRSRDPACHDGSAHTCCHCRGLDSGTARNPGRSCSCVAVSVKVVSSKFKVSK
jgi:hypothetical protein